jgi:hypothetical protein
MSKLVENLADYEREIAKSESKEFIPTNIKRHNQPST